MDSQRNDVSPEAMQARIQQARREAETLKDRIKRKKDELADTTCELTDPLSTIQLPCIHSIVRLVAAVTVPSNSVPPEHPTRTNRVCPDCQCAPSPSSPMTPSPGTN
jgi:hypothetical protein